MATVTTKVVGDIITHTDANTVSNKIQNATDTDGISTYSLGVTYSGTNQAGYISVGTALTTGNLSGLYITSAVEQTNSSSYLLRVRQNNIASVGRLFILDNDGVGGMAYIYNSEPTNDAYSIYSQNLGTGDNAIFNQQGVLGAGQFGLYVYSAAVQINSPLVYFHQDNAASTASVFELKNDGVGHGIYISQTTALGANCQALRIYTNIDQGTESMVAFYQSNASTTGECLHVEHAGTGIGVEVAKSNSGGCFLANQTCNSASDCHGLELSIANAGVGLEYAFWFATASLERAAGVGTTTKYIRVKDSGGAEYTIEMKSVA